MAEITELPDRGAGDGLTTRQRRVLEVIRNSVDRRGYPPSLREIGAAVGLQSPSSVSHQLSALERKGYLRKDPNRPRAIEVLSPDTAPGAHGYRQSHDDAIDETGSGDLRPTPAYVPVLGQIAAGVPITAEEVVDRHLRPASPDRRRGPAVPAQGRRRLDDRRGHLRRGLGRRASAADCRERRHRRGDA